MSGPHTITRRHLDRLAVVSRVCIGAVGAIFGLEISRFARRSADLQRLLEFCSLSDTLIVDADGIYDLRNFNDRLLLGLKGTMSEAELHILAGRLQESTRAAARRGARRFPLPVGYVFEEAGHTVLDAHDEIRAAVAAVFAAFASTGSAYGVVGRFPGRPFPRRAYGGAWAGEIRGGRLTHGRVRGVLSNPAYTGAYVFGRYHSCRVVDPDGRIRTRTVERPQSEWPVIIQGHHPAYISWETFHTNTPGCRAIIAAIVDAAVAQRMLAVVTPTEIAVALAAADEVVDRRARSTRALELRLERTRYDAARAERAFHHCEPENRLVARCHDGAFDFPRAESLESLNL